jgi:hypothetical protein
MVKHGDVASPPNAAGKPRIDVERISGYPTMHR